MSKIIIYVYTVRIESINILAVHGCMRDYFTGLRSLLSSRGIRSPLANRFHNDMPRGKLGHLIILEGPPLAPATLNRSWNDHTLSEKHARRNKPLSSRRGSLPSGCFRMKKSGNSHSACEISPQNVISVSLVRLFK